MVGRKWFVSMMVITLVFTSFSTPSHGFIFRAAARAVGATVGVAAGLAVGAVGFGLRTVKRAAVGTVRLAGLTLGALFGRPYWLHGRRLYRPWVTYRGYYPVQQHFASPTSPMWWAPNYSAHGIPGCAPDFSQPNISQNVGRKEFCAQTYPVPADAGGFAPARCFATVNGSEVAASADSQSLAITSVQRQACEMGLELDEVTAITITCESVERRSF